MATIAATNGKRTDIANPKHLGRKLRKLARLERAKPRRQKGSANREKARQKVAIVHNKVARTRRHYQHKQALALVRENQVIHVESLNVAGLVRNRRVARAISDAAWRQFNDIITEKADQFGRTVHHVSRWLASSKTCSTCQYQLDRLPLHVRQWSYPVCLATHDRDYNAAKVILTAGRAERLTESYASGRVRRRGPGGAPVRPPTRRRGVDEAGSIPPAA